MSVKAKSTISLFITAIIWGSAFVAQKMGLESIGSLYFSAFRMLLGSGALAAMVLITDSIEKRRKTADAGDISSRTGESGEEKRPKNADADEKKTLRIGGLICGVVIFFAFNLQQLGLVSVDAGKTGFITALYIIIVPFLGIFLKHRTTLFNWLGAVIGVAGLYFLCITENFTIMRGDIIVMIGAFFWAAHILFIDHFAPKVNILKLNAYQFFIAGLMSLAVAVPLEDITFGAVLSAAPAICYTAIFSTAIAYSFQAYGQKGLNPTVSSIILSTEALFAVIFGFLFLDETLTFRELLGCCLMFSAVILAQIPSGPREKPLAEVSVQKEIINQDNILPPDDTMR